MRRKTNDLLSRADSTRVLGLVSKALSLTIRGDRELVGYTNLAPASGIVTADRDGNIADRQTERPGDNGMPCFMVGGTDTITAMCRVHWPVFSRSSKYAPTLPALRWLSASVLSCAA
jgi:hypothetical protein